MTVTGNESPSAFASARDLLRIPAEQITYTASQIASQDDVGKLVKMNSSSANTYTLTPDGGTPFIQGQIITVCQYGAGATTLVAAATVTINSMSGYLAIAARYGAVTLIKIDANEWLATGNLKA